MEVINNVYKLFVMVSLKSQFNKIDNSTIHVEATRERDHLS